MRVCRHLKRMDIQAQPEESLPTAVLCHRCASLVERSLELHLRLIHDAQDDTAPKRELGNVLFDISGIPFSLT
jgi:hypothetical protein